MLKEALKESLTPNEISELSSSFDVIGDIAVIKIPQSLESKQKSIGDQILRNMKNVRTVLRQESDVSGEFRLRELVPIAGEEKFETVYKESGVSMKLDLRSVYFSPRLSTERLRIRSLVASGEHILNMFAGVGTFSFIIAKTEKCVIDSVDLNPAAERYAIESLKLNKKMKGVVRPILADARQFALEHIGEYERILMPLPERASEFLAAAAESARKERGSVIHYYVHVPEKDFLDRGWIERHLSEKKLSREFEVDVWKKVREVGPRYVQAVADIRLM